MTQKIKICIADDSELLRMSLAQLLQTGAEFEVVAEAASVNALVKQLALCEADVVLLDAEMSVTGGKIALEILMGRFRGLKVIVMGNSGDTNVMTAYLAAGAASYLDKRCSVAEFFGAIKNVHNNGYFVSDQASKALLQAALKGQAKSEYCVVADFNERETEIIREICDGRTNKEIASRLHLSASTIDFYKGRIYSKTRCNHAVQLFRYALKSGLVALA